MDSTLSGFLMVETSRRNTDLIAGLVYQKPELFKELVEIYLENVEPVSRRAVWVIDTVSEKLPHLLEPYLKLIIERLPDFNHDGLKRNSLRMLTRYPIPKDQQGLLLKICFDWLIAPAESVAVKVYAMEILYRLSQEEPDLKKELADSIEWRMQEETAGFRARGVKTLKKLYREMR